jgi:type III secretory pathway lipoprotein EscJ
VRWLLVLLVACAPVVDGPADKQRAIDRGEGEAIARQLAALPGVVRSEVIVNRPVRDPLSVAPAAKPSSSVVLIVDDRADRAATTDAAKRLVTAAVGVEPTIVVEVGAVRPVMDSIGPFTVEAGSKKPLKLVLAAVLAVLAACAGGIAWRSRPIKRADLD